MNVFDLFAKISLDTSEYDNGLDESSKKTSSFASKISGGLKTAAKVGVGAIAAIGTAAVVATKEIVKGASEVAAYGDNIDKASQKMGISAKAYQEWDAVLQHSGTSIDSMSRGLITLQKNAANSAEKFEVLGLSQEQVASMSTEELFAATISGLQNMGESAERTALASELLGGSAKELGALLNTSAEDTQAMIDKLHEMDGVMSDESVKAAAAYQDSLQDMQTAFGAVKRNLQAEFLPGMTGIMDGLTKIFSGFNDEGLPLISNGVSNLIQNINKSIPKVVSAAKSIIQGIGKAIRDNLPDIMKSGLDILKSLVSGIIEGIPELSQAAMDIIMMLAEYLIENLPSMINAAFELISYLADALVENLPVLIPAIVDIVLQIYDTLTEPDNLMMLLDAAIAIILALADGLIDALPKLLEKAPVIIAHLVEAIVKAVPKLAEAALQIVVKLAGAIADNLGIFLESGMEIVGSIIAGIMDFFVKLVGIGADIGNKIREGFWDFIEAAKTWGKDLMENFIAGITEKIQKLKEKVGSVAQTVKDILGFSEPKEGPLSNFHTYAPDMMELFAKGITDNAKLLTDAVRSTFDIQPIIQDETKPSGKMAVAGAGGAGAGGFTGDIIIPVYMGDEMVQEIVVRANQINDYVSGGR